MNRLERLLDLVHVLQTARAPVSLDALRELFPDYADGSPDATRRKFERDKAELAGIGLVLRFVSEEHAEHGGQEGYWLDADASYLPPIDLGPRDRALLTAAARAALGSEAFPHRAALRLALAKLDAERQRTTPRTRRWSCRGARTRSPSASSSSS
jgi:predicted DNA-binding transcriptional regulator YafY